jgi:ribonuclease BN (tRNA processing enzyme)
MEVTFVGVGEACDESLPNTAVMVRSDAAEGPRSLLLDCGFTAACRYWRHTDDPDRLDALWISHLHGDHFFGVPVLLLRLWEMKRRKPLSVLGPAGLRKSIETAMDLAYPGFRAKLGFPLEFIELDTDKPLSLLGFTWQTAENQHSIQSLALRLDIGEQSLFYSGDGRPTRETLALARHCQVIIHEAFRLAGETPGHGTVQGCIDFARSAHCQTLAVVHVQRDERRDRLREITNLLDAVRDFHAFLPEPDDIHHW